MRFVSTRGGTPPAPLAQAILQGLAPDGGLYLPERITPLAPAIINNLAQVDPKELCATVATALLGDEIDAGVLAAIAERAANFPVPLVALGAPELNLFALELFHGPTLAFKDFGARFLAGVMSHLAIREPNPVTVLVATSGDTGGAVAAGFHGMPGVEVVILYPKDRVSAIQERQLATLGGNITALRVAGSFDDCQRLVKEAFQDPSITGALRCTSANSINIARLVPQTFYYLLATQQLARIYPRAHARKPPVFIVPSGNLGNLTAGLIAHRLGMPATRFVAATNTNSVFTDYLNGAAFTPRPSQRTLSNAMDVGDPSNFERIRALCGSDAAIRSEILGTAVSDQETRVALREGQRLFGYLFDPHGAAGLVAAQRFRPKFDRDVPLIILETAHPAKFGDEIESAIGARPPLPPTLEALKAAPLKFSPIEPDIAALRKILLSSHHAPPR